MPSGYPKNGINKGWFKLGDKTNLGRKFTDAHKNKMSESLKGQHSSPETEFKKGDFIGNLNINWKGDLVRYNALHSWVYRKLGKAQTCTNCNSKRNVQWANKSHEYKRDFGDWLQLCAKCHRRYDMVNLGQATKMFPEIKPKR